MATVQDKAGIEELIEQLKDEDRARRDEATARLVALGETAVPRLIAALKDDNLLVRAHSAIALGLIGDKQAIEPLNQALNAEADDDSEVCLMATVALGKLGDEDTIRFCIEGLEDEDSEERAGSAVALGMIGAKEAIEPLIKALNDPVNDVRCFAAAALGEIGDARVIPYLEKLQKTATTLTPTGRKLREVTTLALESLKARS